MTVKIGINGLGRIGRMVIRSIVECKNKNIEIKHVNNRTDSKTSSLLLKYDSIHGKFNADINFDKTNLIINKNSPEINIYGTDLNGNKKDVLSNEILKEIFASEFVDQAQLTSGNNQFLIYEIISSENKLPTLNNEKVKKNLIKILTAKSVIEKNQEIQKNIIFKKSKQLRLEEMKKIAKDLNITINATSINNINDKNAFKEYRESRMLKKCYLYL